MEHLPTELEMSLCEWMQDVRDSSAKLYQRICDYLDAGHVPPIELLQLWGTRIDALEIAYRRCAMLAQANNVSAVDPYTWLSQQTRTEIRELTRIHKDMLTN